LYEIPSGAMAAAAAARLDFLGHKVDVERAVSFALDPSIHCLHTGKWGDAEVNGLMAGFRTEPLGEAYSMESLVVLPYLLPMVRLQPQFANLVGRYALHVAANMRLFYSDCIPRENQSQPDLTAAVPYERLTREVNGHSPFSSGDYGSHRSIYGGAYASSSMSRLGQSAVATPATTQRRTPINGRMWTRRNCYHWLGVATKPYGLPGP
jgi:hypothetical protein